MYCRGKVWAMQRRAFPRRGRKPTEGFQEISSDAGLVLVLGPDHDPRNADPAVSSRTSWQQKEKTRSKTTTASTELPRSTDTNHSKWTLEPRQTSTKTLGDRLPAAWQVTPPHAKHSRPPSMHRERTTRD